MQLLCQKSRQLTRKASAGRDKPRIPTEGEEGSGMVEAAVGFVFLLLVLLVTFEFLFVFSHYISLLNACVQGAIYAAGHPFMEAKPDDENYQEYVGIIRAEADVGGLSEKDLTINLPQLPPSVETGEPLTVTLDYILITPFGEIFFPLFGKFGLPSQYNISASTSVPLRAGF